MRRYLPLVVIAVAPILMAGARGTRGIEQILWTFHRSSAMSTNGALGARKIPAGRAFRVSAFSFNVGTAAGTATGSQVVRITDGTNNCDATTDCTSSDIRATGPKRSEALSGTCTFAGGSTLSATVQTQCTTAQPSVLNVEVVGYWQ